MAIWREYIVDLKNNIADKYSYVTVKFTELETAIKEFKNKIKQKHPKRVFLILTGPYLQPVAVRERN